MRKFYYENKKTILSGLMIGIGSISFYLFMINIGFFNSIFSQFLDVIRPFIIGYVIAFLAFPVRRTIINLLVNKFKIKGKIPKYIGAISGFIVVIGIMTTIVVIIAPTIIDNIIYIFNQSSNYTNSILDWIDTIGIQYHPIIADLLAQFDFELISQYAEQIQAAILNYLPKVLNAGLGVTSGVIDIFISLLISVYILLFKDELDIQVKRLNYYLFKKKRADFHVYSVRVFSNKFGAYMIGMSIDSMIVGLVCFTFLNLFGYPFASLISFIIGVTNLIPIIGPFIGAIPSFFLILFVNPLQALFFAIFILILQQIEGNIIVPNVLKNSVGMPTFWVLFALIVGGGFYGLLGMIIGVPLLAGIFEISDTIMNRKITKEEVKDIDNEYIIK